MSSSPTPAELELTSLQKHLARSQVAAPLTLLVLIVSALLCSLLASPSLAQVSEQYVTVLTPRTVLIGGYWLVLATLLLGHSLLLAVGTSGSAPLLVNGVGLRLPVVNLLVRIFPLDGEGARSLRVVVGVEDGSMDALFRPPLVPRRPNHSSRCLCAPILYLGDPLAVPSRDLAPLRVCVCSCSHRVSHLSPPTTARDQQAYESNRRMLMVIMIQVHIWQGGLLALG
jgi:hypothetical protein